MLSGRQRDELNKAVADYLKQSGYNQAYSAFKNESEVSGEDENKYQNILAKKWISVVRLQKKNLDLQAQLADVKDEVKEVTSLEGLNRRKDPTQWLPRSPSEHKLNGHRSPILCILCHPNYPIVISGSEDATIKIWDHETGEYERTLKGHTDSVNSIALEPTKSKYLASSSADMTIKIWDFQSGDFQCLKTLKGHDHNISNVNFINQDLICSASRDKSIKIWQVESGFCIKTLINEHTDWIRKVIPSPCKKYIASCSNDQSIKIWDLNKFEVKNDLRDHEHVIEDIQWANNNSIQYIEAIPDKQQPQQNNNDENLTNGNIKSTSRYLVSACRDKSIKFWDLHSNSVLFTLLGHDNWVRSLRFMPGGRYLLSCADDRTIRSWDIENRRCHRTINDAQDHFISCIDVTEKGHKVASGSVDTQIAIWSCR
jgi:platelet-activating factor acetylhydrolase IB subunit alpha